MNHKLRGELRTEAFIDQDFPWCMSDLATRCAFLLSPKSTQTLINEAPGLTSGLSFESRRALITINMKTCTIDPERRVEHKSQEDTNIFEPTPK